MKPRKLRIPQVFHHKGVGQDAVCVRDQTGRRRMVFLGVHGSAEVDQNYREVLAEHFANKPMAAAPGQRPTVGQLAAAFLVHAGRYYVDENKKPTDEVAAAKYSFEQLLELHRDTPTDRIAMRDLLAVRQALVDLKKLDDEGNETDEGRLCRRTINDRMQRVKALFRWGVEQGMVPGSTWHELSALRGLPKGRSGVRESRRVDAVPWRAVELTLPELTPSVRDAVLTQWWTGMRPAEVLAMTRRQMDMSGPTWLYRPARHKGSWRGHERVVAIGPKAQEILRRRLTLAMDVPLFSPQHAWEEFRAEKRATRKTPPTKQMRERDARASAAEPAKERFDVDVYRRAIARACDAAKIEHWSPHKLRHAAGTRIAKEEGIEAARATLGHADLSVTRRYATGADAEIAKGVASRLG